ncbi:MAG TPA: AMP-binding protein, partial [Arthrobacter sp.]|nr:AMP-binding protein [Arthrobacter sp.]
AQKATAEGKGRIFDRAAACAIAYSQALDRGRPGIGLRLQHALFDRLVFKKLRAALGGKCQYAISGGAPLGERLGHFYRGIGLHVLEGYGLTETTAASTANLPEATKIGTAGRPLAGTAVRIAEDGEILLKGGQVFCGYWKNDEATREALAVDGWLHTGDLGDIDEDGYLHITGRKKELLVTAGGKNVAPAPLEDLIRAHPLVSQCMVVGDGKPFIAALITLDLEALPTWAESHGKSTPPAALADDPDLLAEIQGAVDEANRAVSKAESIRKFAILTEDWTEEDGQLTPSLKLKRAVVMREFRDAVESLYR